eukprot:SAG22_NODE_1147_length_5370_cov_3.083855_5_plen_239_part_00
MKGWASSGGAAAACHVMLGCGCAGATQQGRVAPPPPLLPPPPRAGGFCCSNCHALPARAHGHVCACACCTCARACCPHRGRSLQLCSMRLTFGGPSPSPSPSPHLQYLRALWLGHCGFSAAAIAGLLDAAAPGRSEPPDGGGGGLGGGLGDGGGGMFELSRLCTTPVAQLASPAQIATAATTAPRDGERAETTPAETTAASTAVYTTARSVPGTVSLSVAAGLVLAALAAAEDRNRAR